MNKKGITSQHLCFLIFIICFIFSITACSSTPVQISDKRSKGIELNQKGAEAFKKGEYIKALNIYQEALSISRSLENMDSLGKNMINIAYVYYRIGEKDRAHRYVDDVINNIPSSYSAEYTIDAMSIKALIYCDENNVKDSSFWVEKALSLCEKDKCQKQGQLYNIKARISILGGDYKTAMEYGKNALEISKKLDDKAEQGNALRIMADIEFLNRNYDASIGLYEGAFLIDKDLESSEKMIKDLMGIGSNLERQEKFEEAVRYYRRAFSISQGIGNKAMEKSISDSIDRVKIKGQKTLR